MFTLFFAMYLQFTISNLSNPDYHVREAATKILDKASLSAIPLLVETSLTSSNPEVRWRVEYILEKRNNDYLKIRHQIPLLEAIGFYYEDKEIFISEEYAVFVASQPEVLKYITLIGRLNGLVKKYESLDGNVQVNLSIIKHRQIHLKHYNDPDD